MINTLTNLNRKNEAIKLIDNRGLQWCPNHECMKLNCKPSCEYYNDKFHIGNACFYLEMKTNEICPTCPIERSFVPGEGPLDAKLAFFGRDPGIVEKLRKRPFVGDSGQVFDAHLFAVDIERSDCWVDNVVHCKPERNEDPGDEVRELCKFNVYWALARLKNLKIIVAVGRKAEKFFNSKGWIKENYKLMFVYHPSAQLRGSVRVDIIKGQMLKVKEALNGI